jgi:hypothetical protein
MAAVAAISLVLTGPSLNSAINQSELPPRYLRIGFNRDFTETGLPNRQVAVAANRFGQR